MYLMPGAQRTAPMGRMPVSRFFGATRQIGYVVRDIQRAMEFWSGTLGVGPFYVIRGIEFRNYRYRGHPSRPPVIDVAFGNSGDVQIELIQQTNDAPSAYREFLSAGREGMQHVSSWFSDHAEYDRARAALPTIMEQSDGGAKVILAGDTQQLQAVESGGGLSLLAGALGLLLWQQHRKP